MSMVGGIGVGVNPLLSLLVIAKNGNNKTTTHRDKGMLHISYNHHPLKIK